MLEPLVVVLLVLAADIADAVVVDDAEAVGVGVMGGCGGGGGVGVGWVCGGGGGGMGGGFCKCAKLRKLAGLKFK